MKYQSALVIGLTLCGLLIAGGTLAATIFVPGDYDTIQEAVDAAVNGDTVLVGAGVFRGHIDLLGKDIVLASEHGPALTNLRPVNFGIPIVSCTNGEPSTTVIEGFTFSHTGARDGYPYIAAGVHVSNAAPTIRGNHFTNMESWIGNGSGIYVENVSPCLIERNVFYETPEVYACIWVGSDNMTVVNNSINTGRAGIVKTDDDFVINNNTISNCLLGITSSGVGQIDFNNLWNIGIPDKGNIAVDPGSIDAASGNLQLLPGSELINAGDTLLYFADPDGTRNDIGAFPFDLRKASVFNLNVGENTAHVTTLNPAFYWSFFDSMEIQAAYELEVGTNGDWSVAERWSTGPISSSDTAVMYGGSSLAPGIILYWRVRANNGTTWGEWKEHVIRINDPAVPPEPISPTGLASVSVAGIRLRVENTESPFGDDLTYDFEIYSDAGLGTLVDSQLGVVEDSAVTVSQSFDGLTTGLQYWWRCRAYDGYQYSGWSTVETFVVREPMAIRVPNDYATIQAGIEAATEQDTVLVADGTYIGPGNHDLNFNGKNVFLVSENGAAATTIDLMGGPSDSTSLIRVDNHEVTTATIEGFRVINGNPEGWTSVVDVIQGSLRLRHCRFENHNLAVVSAIAGNYDSIPNVIIDSCEFVNNNASPITVFNGGALIRACLFENNVDNGVSAFSWDIVEITGCLFRNNGGEGLYLTTIAGGQLSVTNNTFVGNSTGLHYYYEPPKAGEAPAVTGAAGLITQNVFAYNTEYGVWEDGLGFAATVSCNNAFGNGVEDWNTYEGGQGPIGAGDEFGNISEPPGFCDPEGGVYTIAATSACAPANNSCGLLMGAFPVDPVCTGICCFGATGNVNLDPADVVNLTDLTTLINSLFVTFDPLLCLAEANTSGDEACEISLTDVTKLVNHLFVTFESTAPCDPGCE